MKFDQTTRCRKNLRSRFFCASFLLKFILNNIRIILDEYNRFLDFTNNIEDKKISILWLLSSLVELSHNARIALPHLDQN